jgi:hypothetical protein
LADDEETANEAVVGPSALIVAWDSLTDTIDGDQAEVVAY